MRTSFPRLAAHLLRLRLLGRAGAAGSIFNFFCRFRAEVLSETLISGGVKSRENTKKQDSGNRTNRLGAGEFVDLINIPDGPQKFASIAASLVGGENGVLARTDLISLSQMRSIGTGLAALRLFSI